MTARAGGGRTTPRATSAATRPITLDHLRSRKKPSTSEVPVCLDPALAEKWADAQGDLRMAEMALRERPTDRELQRKVDDAQAVLDELRPEVESETVTFQFRSMGRTAYDDLVDAHPPTKKQLEEAKKEGVGDLNVNPDTFPMALISGSLTNPELSVDDVKQLWADDNWNSAELTRLYAAAIAVNSTSRVVNLGKG